MRLRPFWPFFITDKRRLAARHLAVALIESAMDTEDDPIRLEEYREELAWFKALKPIL